ncbi:MAG: protein kinase, partial [Myxococcales bacterium]|nr:protein kinase [Myxococcales bacterium]
MSSLVGQSLDGRYLLRRVISSGSKAVIFEGQHTVTNRLVVVKILSEDRFDDPKARHALLEEARMLTVVDHPCILRVVDAGTAELDDDVATAFLATELVEGRTMEGTVAARGALELSEGLQLGLTLLRAIDWMHRLGLVHGALNPRHVIVPGLHPADRGWDLRAPDARLLGFGAAARAAV